MAAQYEMLVMLNVIRVRTTKQDVNVVIYYCF